MLSWRCALSSLKKNTGSSPAHQPVPKNTRGALRPAAARSTGPRGARGRGWSTALEPSARLGQEAPLGTGTGETTARLLEYGLSTSRHAGWHFNRKSSEMTSTETCPRAPTQSFVLGQARAQRARNPKERSPSSAPRSSCRPLPARAWTPLEGSHQRGYEGKVLPFNQEEVILRNLIKS